MNDRKTLFVTYSDENIADLHTYTTELSRSMKAALVVLFLKSRSEREKWDTVLMAAAFGEANMSDTAREMMKEVTGVNKVSDDHPDQGMVRFIKTSRKAGINPEVYSTRMDLNSAMNALLKQDREIEFVLLSPEVSRSEVSKKGILTRLRQSLSRPFATMTKRPAHHLSGAYKSSRVSTG